jgi:hypothetical protein
MAGMIVLAGLAACGAGTPAAPPPAAPEPVTASATGWAELEAGLELGTFASPRPSEVGDSLVRVLRIDPGRFELRLMNASAAGDGLPLTARQWCDRHGLVAAINPSMYQQDHRTSVSLMRTSTHVNNPRQSKDMTVLAFEPLSGAVPPVAIIDRECDDLDALRSRYGTLIQSIRMISCNGRNVWAQQPRRWSTAAIALDRAGRVLFIHVRSPYSTHDLIEILRALPLDIDRAMYAEGGPEAQLFVRSGEKEHEFVGSFETGFLEGDDNRMAWPVPNVVGVLRRAGRGD